MGFKRWISRQWSGWLGKLVKDSVKMTVKRKLEEELHGDRPPAPTKHQARRRKP